MFRRQQLDLFDFIASLSRTMDLMDSAVVAHHFRVAYIALRLAEELGLSVERRRNILWAGMLHDIGAFYFHERLHLLESEIESAHQHAEAGCLLLKIFKPFSEMATLVRFHHVPWENGKGALFHNVVVPEDSHVLHLADRIASRVPALPIIPRDGRDKILEIANQSGERFIPENVEAFLRLAEKEFFWLEMLSPSMENILRRAIPSLWIDLQSDLLTDFAYLLCRLIDFKSHFTATHSSGVAASAVTLAAHIGFSRKEQQTMRIAAYLHDLGKLAVPAEIIEKPGRLSAEERDVMMGHVYFTYDILSRIDGFETVTAWSSLHQERMDGSGYPFHFREDDLPLGARVMAVADVFTAITEDRPYRKGMPADQARHSMEQLAKRGALDARIVGVLLDNFDEINGAREAAQRAAAQEYEEYVRALEHPFSHHQESLTC